MNAKELMIGDWVYIDIVTRHSLSPTIIETLDKDSINGEDNRNFSPIPLTPEILEKNGFKNIGSYEWRDDIYVTRWRYCTQDFNYGIEITYTPEYDGFAWYGNDVNNVHTLQHALRLCGLNDLADNFKVE